MRARCRIGNPASARRGQEAAGGRKVEGERARGTGRGATSGGGRAQASAPPFRVRRSPAGLPADFAASSLNYPARDHLDDMTLHARAGRGRLQGQRRHGRGARPAPGPRAARHVRGRHARPPRKWRGRAGSHASLQVFASYEEVELTYISLAQMYVNSTKAQLA